MSKKKKALVFILMALLLAVVAAGLFWHSTRYVMFDFRFIDRNARELDLRQETLSAGDYERLQRRLPDCHIIWNVPFQDGYAHCESTQLTVTELTQEDVQQLRYFPELKILHAEDCPDLDMAIMAQKTYPQLQVRYLVPVAGQAYSQDTRILQLDQVSQEDISVLYALPKLDMITLSGVEDPQAALDLEAYCEKENIGFGIVLGKDVYDRNAEHIEVEGITLEQLSLFRLMPQLKKIHLVEPLAPAQELLALRQSRSGLTVTWEKSIWGKVCSDDTLEVDLSDATVGTLEEVEEGMTYLPNATKLFLGFCNLDNEQIAAYRERSRDQYKVVWVVDLSGKMKVRTDIDNFMPSRDGWGYVRDHEIDNIRYCEDLICMDIGHMGVKDVSFLEPLVNLEYLILAHTEVQYIDAIVNCKKLKFLELDWSCIRDVSPLVECTALEDLNVGMAWPDITPLLQMTWLKNLYLIKGNSRANFAEHLPNTRVITSGEYTVSNGWRNLPNYYAMRDILGMPYM